MASTTMTTPTVESSAASKDVGSPLPATALLASTLEALTCVGMAIISPVIMLVLLGLGVFKTTVTALRTSGVWSGSKTKRS